MTEQNQKMETEAAQMLFDIKRVYVKDISFESPSAPEIFNKDWQPEIQMDMNFSSNALSTANYYEVALRITLTAKIEENTAFLCEVVQAGIFEIDGLEGEQLSHCLSAYCPNILFPYARECIASLITRGTFQPINLMPVNFDALFMQYLEQQKNVTNEASNEASLQAH